MEIGEIQFDVKENLNSMEKAYGVKVAREVVQIFLVDYKSKLQNLRQGIEDENTELIRFQAHNIKSGCLSMGLKPMSDLCEKIEYESERFSRNELNSMFQSLEDQYKRFSCDFEQYLNLTH